jgi:hypothetical protein
MVRFPQTWAWLAAQVPPGTCVVRLMKESELNNEFAKRMRAEFLELKAVYVKRYGPISETAFMLALTYRPRYYPPSAAGGH